MRVLLDECVDRRFAKQLAGHQVSTVQEMGWAGMKNGELLRTAESEFQIFITVDRNLYFQQAIPNLQIGVIVLCAHSNRLVDLLPLIPQVLRSIDGVEHGEVIQIRQ